MAPELETQDSGLNTPTPPRVSVLMPTFGHAHVIRRAIDSLLQQTLGDWELVIVDDGSPDDTAAAVVRYLEDPRVSYHRLKRNIGLGAALNRALALAKAPLIAYLPSDDVLYPEHLARLARALEDHPEAALAFSGVRHTYSKRAEGQIEGYALQLVQVMHRRLPPKWVERAELTTDDLERMYWGRLRPHGAFVGTGEVTAEWVNHPHQRHKVIREPLGGVNPYRIRYGVREPLRFHSTVGNVVDEVRHYRRFRDRPDTPMAPDGLRILLVGELAYNPERVLALEERGHKLYGLWTDEGYGFNYAGPMPFGHVEELPREGWQRAAKKAKIDVIYALLNWQTVRFCHRVMKENPGLPFVWHFKEGPFICLEHGMFRELVELYLGADGQIYSGDELRDWFETVVPGIASVAPSLSLDGDLPKREWFNAAPAPRRLSEEDGQIHTVIPGRPIGIHPWTCGELAEQGIHLHFYSDFVQGQWKSWIDKANAVAKGYLHLHPTVDQDRWVEEFSKYDAAWLHVFQSTNFGDLRRSDWDDLNLPARIGTYAAAGLPMIQYDNSGSIVSMQSIARRYDVGVFFKTAEELRAQLGDEQRMAQLRANMWAARPEFTFDHHADTLIGFLRRVLAEQG
ncbi:MAG: hypothetical protein RLZZ387_5363 [Chloroflexota bacterium]